MRTGITFVRLLLALGVLVGWAAVPSSAAASPPAAPSAGQEASTPALLSRQATTMSELHQQVQGQLALAPGGKRTAVNEVSYLDGRLVITFALPGRQAAGVADCPSGWFCFYDNNNFGYPRGKLSDCGWQDLDWYGWSDRVQSVHHRGRATLEWSNHLDSGDEYLWTSQPSVRQSTVPYPNRADHVYQICLLP